MSVDKLRVMVLTEKMPYPLSQGVNLRIFNFVKYLQADCDFDLFYKISGDLPRELHAVFNEIIQLPASDTMGGAVEQKGFFRSLSYNALVQPNEIATEFLKEVIDRYDVVLATTHLLPYLDFDRTTPVVVDVIDDAVLQKWREMGIMDGFRNKLRNLYYMYLHLLFERHYCSQSNIAAAFITSEVDAAVFSRVSGLRDVRVIQNGVDTDYFCPVDHIVDDGFIVFEGNMTFDQNVVGAAYFCKEVLPIILQERPTARLVLVGRDPSVEVLALADHPAVTVTGTVDDIRPYIGQAAVFVCPLLSGGGIKNKILQAWSMRKACVATSLSIGGLGVQDGKNILVRDGAKPFAEAVLNLLADSALRAEIGEEGRRSVERNYTWEKKSAEVYRLLRAQV